MLDDVTSLQEVYLYTKANKVDIVMHLLDGTEDWNSSYRHSIIKITLKNGEKYALDLSGAQFGHSDPLLPWERYVKTRAEYIEETKPLGSYRKRTKFLWKPKSGGEGIVNCDEEIARIVNAAIDEWQKTNGTLRDLLRLQEKQFMAKREAFFGFIEASIEAKRGLLEEAGIRQSNFELKPEVRYDIWSGKPIDKEEDGDFMEKVRWQ